jgi:hypothetical protein
MLRITARSAAALTIAITLLAACDAAPTGPDLATPARTSTLTPAGSATASATPWREGATVPFTFGLYVPCANGGAGDVVDATGELTYQGTRVVTAGERNHYALLLRFTGTAIAETSGETYDAQSREVDQGSMAYGDDGILDSGEDFQRLQVRLIGRTTGEVIDVVLDVHFVETPTGEYVLGDWEGTARCR